MLEYNDENRAKIQELAEYLRGTCKGLDEAAQEIFQNEDLDLTGEADIKLLYELDDITMQCESCNWWCETGELNDQQECSDCAPEDDED